MARRYAGVWLSLIRSRRARETINMVMTIPLATAVVSPSDGTS